MDCGVQPGEQAIEHAGDAAAKHECRITAHEYQPGTEVEWVQIRMQEYSRMTSNIQALQGVAWQGITGGLTFRSSMTLLLRGAIVRKVLADRRLSGSRRSVPVALIQLYATPWKRAIGTLMMTGTCAHQLHQSAQTARTAATPSRAELAPLQSRRAGSLGTIKISPQS